MRYLLDTNLISDLMRNPQGRVAQAIADVGEDNVCTSIVVAAELRYGVAKKGSDKLSARLDAILQAIEILPLEEPVDVSYGLIRHRLEQSGQPTGGNDLLIAAQALSLGYTVATDNDREFRRVNGLAVVNWLR